MKSKCNLFGLLSRGVTTTHPLCSVFTLFILSLCFVFCFGSISVSAAVSNIPESDNWQLKKAIEAYGELTDSQKDIANFLTGSQGYAYAGLSQSNLNSNFSSWDATIQSVKDFGAKMWSDFNSRTDNIVSGMLGVTNDLSNFFGNAVTYAKSRNESFSAWLGNVGIDYNSTSEFRIQFGKDQVQDNIQFFGDQGLYEWQYHQYYYDPALFSFTWREHEMTAAQQESYFNLLGTLTTPNVKFNDNYAYNTICGSSFFSTYCNIFVNTSTNLVYFCDNNGNRASSSYSGTFLHYEAGFYPPVSSYTNNINVLTLNYNNYNSLYNLYNAISNDSRILLQYQGSSRTFFCLADFVQGLYIGDSWDHKVPWSIVYDLNLTSTSNYVTVNSPSNVIYLDLNGFMHDLYQNPSIIVNYVIDNSVDGDGNPVDNNILNPISKFPTIPASGINIGIDFFKLPGSDFSIFDTYIADLWRNTKGMVLYCADILSVFTPDEGVGLAYIVYGGIAIGVIGGIFSKFLL